ncbi:MAG: ATP-dependent DNA helicase [Mariprofundaceae bacterium]|nr:ATP-dependent DNA helicase [Mariprofundaceae bacterium]
MTANDNTNGTFAISINRDFQPDGPLATAMPGYVCREEQVKLAGEIADAMQHATQLMAEAETGTGKTLAYLVPALRSQVKVLISTHTKALQDQLMFRDIPGVQQALGVRRRIALLKGRSNYLCPHRLEKNMQDITTEPWMKKKLLRVNTWRRKTRSGDLSELPFDVFSVGIGNKITATAEQCLGSKCPLWNECPIVLARQAAQDADIVVSNHSLLLADAELKSGDFGEVLPDFDVTILDEAHALPDLACRHFGRQIALNRLTSWHNDMQKLLEEFADETPLKRNISKLFLHVLEAYDRDDLRAVLVTWQELAALSDQRRERSDDAARLAERSQAIGDDMQAILEPPEGFVAWREGSGNYSKHLLAPVETGPVLNEKLWPRSGTFILLSATLRISGSFAYMGERLGLNCGLDSNEEINAQAVSHPSPFDYATQAMIYAPRHLPPPGAAGYEDALFAEMQGLIEASSGRAFVLFTSHGMLKRVAPRLAKAVSWSVLIQNESGSRDAILQQFREDKHSVLCGTRSFWEGVDVPGEALSLVIIDKMPFAPPDDKLLAARRQACEKKGGNGFFDIQLPEAVATLRQGAGRLIRTQQDRGVIAILDSRLYVKSYGRIVAKNLPPAPKTEELADIRRFFARQ